MNASETRKSTKETLTHPRSTMAVLNLVSTGRIALGTAAILAPTATMSLLRMSLNPHGTIVAAMFGSREMAIGILLYVAKNRFKTSRSSTEWGVTGSLETRLSEGGKDVRKMLLAGIGVDGLDFVCCVGALLTGVIDVTTFGLLGGGAASMVGMQLWSLRSFGRGSK